MIPGHSCGVTNAFAMLDPSKLNSWQSSAQFQCKSTHNEEDFEESMEKLEEIKCSKEGVEFCSNLKSKRLYFHSIFFKKITLFHALQNLSS